MQWLVYNYKTRLAEWLNWLTAIFTAIIFFSCGFLDQIPAGTDWVEFLYCYYECFDIAVMIFWYLIIKPWDDSSGSLRVAFIIYWFCVFFMVNFLLCYHQLFSFLIIFVGISLTAFVYHSTATYEVYTKKNVFTLFCQVLLIKHKAAQLKFGPASLNSVRALLWLH